MVLRYNVFLIWLNFILDHVFLKELAAPHSGTWQHCTRKLDLRSVWDDAIKESLGTLALNQVKLSFFRLYVIRTGAKIKRCDNSTSEVLQLRKKEEIWTFKMLLSPTRNNLEALRPGALAVSSVEPCLQWDHKLLTSHLVLYLSNSEWGTELQHH